MKKLLAITLSLLMVFSVVPMVMVSAAQSVVSVETLTCGSTNTAHKSSKSSDPTTDGYRYKISGSNILAGDQGYYITIPSSVWELDPLAISYTLKTEDGVYRSNGGYFYFANGAKGATPTASNTVVLAGNWKTINATGVTYNFDLTSNSYANIKTNKLNTFYLYNKFSSSNLTTAKGLLVVDVTVTCGDIVEYPVTIDGVEVAKVQEGKTFTVPTPAEGYHYTDGTIDYVGGEVVTINADLVLTSAINTYDVTLDGAVVATVEHGSTYTVPTPSTGYDYTDGTTTYVGGEEITVTGAVALTSVLEKATVTYTMDEGSRMTAAYTNNMGEGAYVEVDGDWKLGLRSKGDQIAYFQLPADWFKKPYHKATGISFKLTRSANAASYANYVRFADTASNTNYVSISEGYKSLATSYSVDVTEDLYGYRYFTMQLKNGTNWTAAAPTYVYIDDVTVTFEYDPAYVGYDVTIDGETVATIAQGDTYTVPTPSTGSYYTDGTNTYVGGEVITVNSAVDLTTKLYEYDVTVDGEVVATVAYGSTYTVVIDDVNYYLTDGTTKYYAGEVITVTAPVALVSKPVTSTATYTMDPGSRITSGSTNACTPGAGEFVEVDGNWVFKLPSKEDQIASFVLPEDWYEKENCKAVSIEFSVAKTSGGADATQWVSFTNGTDSISISNGYTALQTKYSVAVDESVYSYRTLQMFLKGGSNFSDAEGYDYIYIDDVTVNFEYDPNYVAPEEPVVSLVSTDEKASIRLNELNGIRFYTSFDMDAINALNVNNETVEFGTIIAPADIINGDFTHEDDHIDVKYTATEYWTGNEFVGSIVNIKEANINRDFVGRGYVKIGDTYYYSETTSTRSLAGVADACIADIEYFDSLDADTKVLVENWAKAND